MDYLGLDAKLAIWIPDHNVSVITGGDRAFASIKANLFGRRVAQPLCCLINREAARACSVHITGRRSCREEIPPQAFMKSPSSRNFMSGGQGEGSETTISIIPSRRASHSCSLLARSR